MNSKIPGTQEVFNMQRVDFQKMMIKTSHWLCCLNCLHFKEETAMCEKFKAVPPLVVIVAGCKDYDMDIPF